jgi:hypothetical protein
MSRFINNLRQASKAVSPPMGFRAAETASKPRMLLIAHLPQADINHLAGYVAGADAGLISITKPGSGAKILKDVSQLVPGIPWGGWLGSASRGGINKLVVAGCDFVVFPPDASLAILDEAKVGKILAMEALLDEGLIKAVNELPADAVFITGGQERLPSLTWHHLMLFRRFVDLLSKPLLVPMPSDIAANELQALWDAGVDGVVVEVVSGQPVETVNGLSLMIDGLTLPVKRKRRQPAALLPGVRGESNLEPEEE